MGDHQGGASSQSQDAKKKLSDKDLDLSNTTRGVWLVKVPNYIADRWKECKGQEEVGKLKIARRPNMKPAVSFSLDDSVIKQRTEVGNGTLKQLPKEHKFVVNSVAMQTLAVFSHTKGESEVPDKLALEGNVVQRAECRPISNNLYMGLKKEAIIKAIEPTRKTIQIGKVAMAYKPISNHASNIAYDKKKKADGKKSRDDKEVVMERLFALFEKHQYYNIKDLMAGTRQPITYLKEILKEVCSYSMKNPHKNMWELKPEYRHYKSEKADEEEGGDGGGADGKGSGSSDSSDDE